MSIVICQKEKIDRLRITVPLNPDQYSVALTVLHGIGDVADTPDIKHWRSQYGARLALKSGSQSLATLHAGITKQQYRYFCWETWPDHLARDEYRPAWESLQYSLNLLIGTHGHDDAVYSLDHAIDTGKVSYIEVARDYVGVEKESILPWTSHSRKGDIFKDHEQGTKGAVYIGSKDSPRQFVVYDKKKHLLSKGINSPYPSLLRIEARLRNPGVLARDIDQLGNPFDSLHIASLSKARALSKEKAWQSFIQTAANDGAVTAFSTLSKHHRKTYRERLTQCDVGWW